jgi:hypothetical protein
MQDASRCGICPINNLFGCELALTIRASTFPVCRVLVRRVSTAYFRSYVTLKVPITSEEVSTKPTGKVDIIGEVSMTISQTSPVCCRWGRFAGLDDTQSAHGVIRSIVRQVHFRMCSLPLILEAA